MRSEIVKRVWRRNDQKCLVIVIRLLAGVAFIRSFHLKFITFAIALLLNAKLLTSKEGSTKRQYYLPTKGSKVRQRLS